MSRNLNLDPVIILSSVVLCSLGLASISSVAPSLFLTQLFFALIGLGLYFLMYHVDYKILHSFAVLFYLFAIVALLSTLFFGFASHGAVRWIQIGAFRLQFSEFLKPFLICSGAFFLTSINQQYKRLFYSLILAAPIFFLVFRQPDLGGTIVYIFSFALMSFVGGIDWKLVVTGIIGVSLSWPVFWKLLAEYQKKRLINFLNPEHDVLGSGYNVIQAIITVGSGMWLGTGLGRGTQSHLDFLPERHTDFIFASFAEEFGFFGSFFLLAVYFILLFRLIQIFSETDDSFGRLVLAGLIGMFFIQMFINVGMNIGVVPVTGITLPFVSYGGSSLLASFLSLGIAANIHRQNREKKSFD